MTGLEILIDSSGGLDFLEFRDLGTNGGGALEADLGDTIGGLNPPVCRPCTEIGRREKSAVVDLLPTDRRLPPLFTLRVSEAMAMASSIDVTVERDVGAYKLAWLGEDGVAGDGTFMILLSGLSLSWSDLSNVICSGRGAFRIFSPPPRADSLVCARKPVRPVTSCSFRAFLSVSIFSRTSDSDIGSGDEDLIGYGECIIAG